MNRQCPKNSLISAFIDKELPEHQMEEMRLHFNICKECRKEAALLQETDNIIKALPEIEPSNDFQKGFWKKIAAMEDKKIRWSFLDLFRFKYRSYATAALAVILIAGFIIFNKSPQIPGSEEVIMAENLELFKNLLEIDHLDLLENWEEIMSMNERS